MTQPQTAVTVVDRPPVQRGPSADSTPGLAVLLAHMDALGLALMQAQTTLEPSSTVDERLRARVRVRMNFLIEQERSSLICLGEQLRPPGAPTPRQLKAGWTRYGAIHRACRPLFAECMALAEGTASRRGHPPLDRGLCALADALLDDLSYRSDIPWGRFTILALGESYGELAEIVRLRFPFLSVWELPVAAHEFGHFLALRLQRRGSGRRGKPVEEWLARLDGPQQKRFLHEHLADAFGTLAMGPAYAYTSLRLRLDPSAAADDGRGRDPAAKHPTDQRRAFVILRVLERAEPQFAPLAEAIEGEWVASRRGAGRRDGLTRREGERLKRLAGDLLAVFAETLPADVRYTADDWAAARELESDLLGGNDGDALPQGATIQRLLNAGWRARGRVEPDRLGQVENRVREVCHKLADASRDDAPWAVFRQTEAASG